MYALHPVSTAIAYRFPGWREGTAETAGREAVDHSSRFGWDAAPLRSLETQHE